MKQETITKLNDTMTVEVTTFNERVYRIIGRKNGEAIESRHMIKSWDVEEMAQELISDMIAAELGGKPQEMGTVLVEGFTYNVWVEVTYYEGKVSYHVSTIHQDDEEVTDKNVETRKTWKGLKNYVTKYRR